MEEAKVHSALAALQVAPQERTKAHMQSLGLFLSHMSLFQRVVDPEKRSLLVTECCKHLICRSYTAQAVVFQQGDTATEVFFVFSGEVAVSKLASPRREVAVFPSGACLGEQAWINRKCRTTTAQCTAPSILGVLGEAVLGLFLNVHQQQFSDTIGVLKQLPYFKYWSTTSLQRLSFNLERRTYLRGQALFTEGEPCTAVYILTKGEVKLTKTHKQKASEYALGGKRLVQKELPLVVKENLKLLGFEDILNNVATRSHSCRALGTAEVLVLARDDFLKKMQNPSTVRVLEAHRAVLSHWQETRLQKLQEAENFKLPLAHTPRSRLRTPACRHRPTPSPNVRQFTPHKLQPQLPRILQQLLTPARREWALEKRQHPVNSAFFSTELPSTLHLSLIQR